MGRPKPLEALVQKAQRIESPLFKSIFTQGKVRGVAEGEAQTYANLIHKMLLRWLGPVDASFRQHVEQFRSREIFDVWCDEAIELHDAESARKLLDKILRTPVPPSADGSSQAA